GDGLGQQRLAGAGGPDEEDALGDAAAQGAVLFRGLEEIDDLAQLQQGLVDAGDVLEVDAQVFLGVDLGPAAAEGQRRATAREPADEQEDAAGADAEEEEGQQPGADGLEWRVLLGALVAGADGLLELRVQALVVLQADTGGAEGDELRAPAVEVAVGDEVGCDHVTLDLAVVDLDLLQAERGRVLPADVEELNELPVLEVNGARFPGEEPADKGGGDQHQEKPRRHEPAPPTATRSASFLHRRYSRG